MDDASSQDLLADLPVVQRLALAYASAAHRARYAAFFALDNRLAQIVRGRREVVLAQMRLAWWRDMLAKPVESWPKGDAVLAALRAAGEPAALGALVDGWEALLAETFGEAKLETFLQGRAAGYGWAANSKEGAQKAALRIASDRLSLTELSANIADEGERDMVSSRLTELPGSAPLERAMRPLKVLDGLAMRANKRARAAPLLDGPADMAVAIRLGLFGR